MTAAVWVVPDGPPPRSSLCGHQRRWTSARSSLLETPWRRIKRGDPRARWRSQVVRYARPAPDGIALTLEATSSPAGLTQAWTWAALMRRVFALDVLACPRYGGRLRVSATVQDPAVVRAILAHLGVAPAPNHPGPAPPQPDHTATAR